MPDWGPTVAAASGDLECQAPVVDLRPYLGLLPSCVGPTSTREISTPLMEKVIQPRVLGAKLGVVLHPECH